ncbi:imidazole glycerol phosphate synthase subunit HisH [Liquorilactobacillus oeni]|uniref:Imidazole glycerol phosphate synthase subunit HisH n=1 Tax=Liquorilactobacillus oeni DSM 19972 TaxID=1423777 RepID=A0A0R1MF81_9LACO|nr:imidazole glycerol phosphate synthase subunit HisH [Liquorilactobacillus oeni]KRL03957.1 imidazole glycerol phosphate synthase subunit HisH [Liquorilactobacillus oeni DSM 19972]
MLTIIDYDAGNTYNVKKAFDFLGVKTRLTADPAEILASRGLILPGVGAFAPAMQTLRTRGLDTVIKKAVMQKTPLLGICLGMQLLFESSSEYGEHKGLGLIPGKVIALPRKKGYKVPQMGWNENELIQKNSVFSFVAQQYTYFVHSFYADCDNKYIVSRVDYSVPVPAIVQNKNVYGLQFHPEKSGNVGIKILQTFVKEIIYNDNSGN